MKRKLKTLEVVRDLAAEYRKTGDLARLLAEVSSWSWWLGRYREYNHKLFLRLLLRELEGAEVKDNEGDCSGCGEGISSYTCGISDMNSRIAASKKKEVSE
jgi:hypothetical protein